MFKAKKYLKTTNHNPSQTEATKFHLRPNPKHHTVPIDRIFYLESIYQKTIPSMGLVEKDPL